MLGLCVNGFMGNDHTSPRRREISNEDRNTIRLIGCLGLVLSKRASLCWTFFKLLVWMYSLRYRTCFELC